LNLEIRGRHLDVKETIRGYIEERAERLTRYYNRITKMQFVLSKQGVKFSAEVVVSAPRAGQLVAEATEEGLQAAVDKALDKMERQIRRFKEKLRDHHREAGRTVQRDEGPKVSEEEEEEGAD
jgi:putative sigma-54 modulation protein